ncbi:MAG: glycosyltransferase family 39 protein [Thermoflavifilum sp.]|nr:glycosyltransferase family 39 protein [Thermoflavifilum sp.]
MNCTETLIKPLLSATQPQKPTRFRDLSRYFLLFLGGWVLINVLQAIFTQLNPDEAYYWLYAQHLAWGYFDHPPLIALMIRIGSSLIPGELGVRLLTIVAQAISLFVIWKIAYTSLVTGRQNLLLFFGIAGSIALFDAYGFVSTPDAPLLLFESLFLWAYQRYLRSSQWSYALLLGLFMTGMMYSKYHAFLVIALVWLSNPQLFKDAKAWIAGLMALLLYMPHIWWEFQHRFPSLEYHLIDRAEPFRWAYLLEYWPNQMAALNPFTLGLTLYLIFRYKPANRFEKSLYFLVVGFQLFFWLSAFRGHVEPQWTIATAIPMIILLYRKSLQQQHIARFVRRWIFPTLLLILFARILLILEIPSLDLPFYGHRQWAKALEEVTGKHPVVFMDSYQKPALYSFYTGQPAFTLNSVYYRKNQFDIWKKEILYHHQRCALISNSQDPFAQQYMLSTGQVVYVHFTRQLPTIEHLRVYFTLPNTQLHAGDTLRLRVKVYNPYPFAIDLQNPEFPISLSSIWIWGLEKWNEPVQASLPTKIPAKDSLWLNAQWRVPHLPATHVHLGLSFQAGVVKPAFNSAFIPVMIH